MYEPLRRRVLAFLKVPLEPQPPAGDPASLRVFRAGRNYFRLRIAGWAAAQLLALAAILFWTTMLIEVESMTRAQRHAHDRPSTATIVTSAVTEPGQAARPIVAPSSAGRQEKNRAEKFADAIRSLGQTSALAGKSAKGRHHATAWFAGYKQALVEIALLLPDWAFPLLWALKIFSIVVYLVQIPFTYAVRRLDYEMRWYMVTDRSLRLRHGVWKVSESTMSFANLQQVVVSQDPLQRLLGLANVNVKSAGGGARHRQQKSDDMHTGLFQAVTNAPEIRDLILARLRRFRETGLGDPDDSSPSLAVAPAADSNDPLAASRELLAEARALRATLS